mmetsp:Transcript_152593/g.292209  ORF Transcript_152593/g.292209 Transcript_152593/m.292209 type:complete len:360 (+) Transcript_152593:52-1131(+)
MACSWLSEEQLDGCAVFLDGRSIAAFAGACSFVHNRLHCEATLRWLIALRGLPKDAGITCVEHVEIAETMAELEGSIQCRYGQTEMNPAARPKIQRFAALLKKHTSLTVSIEAHCGLEAPSHSFARHFSRRRAESVRQAFMVEGVEESRMKIRAWGFTRPLVWAHGEPEGSPNRRVELFISTPGGFEAPQRRPLSDYAAPPGADRIPGDARPLANGDEEGEDSSEEEDEEEYVRMLIGGRFVVVPVAADVRHFLDYREDHEIENRDEREYRHSLMESYDDDSEDSGDSDDASNEQAVPSNEQALPPMPAGSRPMPPDLRQFIGMEFDDDDPEGSDETSNQQAVQSSVQASPAASAGRSE